MRPEKGSYILGDSKLYFILYVLLFMSIFFIIFFLYLALFPIFRLLLSYCNLLCWIIALHGKIWLYPNAI